MSMYFGPFTVAVGALTPITTTQFPNANIAVLINESPYTLKVDPGTGSYFVISAFTQDAVPLGNQFSGVLKVTAADDITFTGTAPASVLYVQMYARGEPLPGTYPSTLARQVNVGGGTLSQATSVVQTGNPAPTPVLSATPSATFLTATEQAVINNDGSANFGHITPAAEKVLWDNVGNLTAFSLKENGGGVDASLGGMTSKAAVTLATGNQETGHCGGGNSNGAAGGTNLWVTNYKTVMTNQPTSITFTAENTNNTGSPFLSSASDIYGFTLGQIGTVAGATIWIGKYLTAGN